MIASPKMKKPRPLSPYHQSSSLNAADLKNAIEEGGLAVEDEKLPDNIDGF